MATIKDLAKYCNVSVTTVSYALNNNQEISDETREKVKKAATQLGYVPSAYARGLKSKKTYNIGVFIPGFDGPIHHTVLSGIAKELERSKTHYNMLVTLADNNMNLIKEKSVDLAIIMDSRVQDETVVELARVIPIITFDSNITGDNIYPTYITNEEGMYNLANNLIQKGCKKIAYLLGAKESYHNQLRYLGYIKALKDANILFNPELVYNAKAFTEEKGYKLISKLTIERGPLPFDALMCGNDELALGAMRALKENGYQIPRDVLITGFDNIDKDILVTPSLTSIAINWLDYGKKMARLALNILSGLEDQQLVINTRIVERESTKNI